MGDEYPIVKLAAVQAAPVWLDRDATVDKACELIVEAGDNGADIVGFPENFIPGHPVWFYYHPATSERSVEFAVRLFKNSVEIPGSATDALCRAARRAGAHVVVGLTEKLPGSTGTLFNTQLFIDDRGEIIGKHQKLVPTIGERLVHAGGSPETQRTFDTRFGTVSGLCCGENSNPFAVSMLAAEYTRVHVAAWPNHFIPSYCGMCESSLLASRNVAYMCKTFVISACGTNGPDMIEELPASEDDRAHLLDTDTTGGSAIINPRGDVIAGPLPGDQEGLLYANADLEATLVGRYVHDFGGHYNRPDVYSLRVDRTPRRLLEATSAGREGPTNERDEAAAVQDLGERTGGRTAPLVPPSHESDIVAGRLAEAEA